MKVISLVSALLLVAATGAQAQGMSMPMASTPAASANAKAPATMVDAVVQKLDAKKGTVVLKHGDITNLGMPAMTMGFDVANKKMLKGLKVGDKVRFHADMVKGKAQVTKLEHVK